jgi:hypothetical protein
MVTKRPYNWSPGLILGACCPIFRSRPVGTGLGAKFLAILTHDDGDDDDDGDVDDDEDDDGNDDADDKSDAGNNDESSKKR